MRAILSGRFKFALAFVMLALLVPVGVLAAGQETGGAWGSDGSENTLNLRASPGETVSAWARVSVRWQDKADQSADRFDLDVDDENTTLPGFRALSMQTLTIPSPLGEGEYVWDGYRIYFQAPDAPGEYQYLLRLVSDDGEPAGVPDLTINLKVG